MNSPLRPLFAAAALALALAANPAVAGLLVTGTPASGTAGSLTVLHPTMQVTTGNTGMDFSKVSFWDFKLDWDETALRFDPGAAIISFGSYSGTLSNFVGHMQGLGIGSVYTENLATTVGDGYFFLGWDGFSGTAGMIDLGSAIDFSGAFTVLAGAAPGNYEIRFDPGSDSVLADENFVYATYGAASPPMQITVQSAIPEPGVLSLLLGGLGALGIAGLRRKASN